MGFRNAAPIAIQLVLQRWRHHLNKLDFTIHKPFELCLLVQEEWISTCIQFLNLNCFGNYQHNRLILMTLGEWSIL